MFEKVVGTMPGGGSVTQEEYYGDVFALLKQGEVYLKKVMEMYPNDNTQDELQSILYTKTRIKTPESMMEKLKRRGLETDCRGSVQESCDSWRKCIWKIRFLRCAYTSDWIRFLC